MPGQLTFTIKYKKNTGSVISVVEMWNNYLYGITIQAGIGTAFSDDALRTYLSAAQKEVENYFNLKFVKQLVESETHSYYRTDYFQQFPIIQTNCPVRIPLALTGMLNKMEQIIYPQTWLTCEKDMDGIGKRRMSVVPTGASSVRGNADVILTGITTQIGFQRYTNIPDYWDIQYVTGFDLDKMPLDLINLVGKLASFGPLNIAGDMIFNLPGVASMHLEIDGLRQSINSTASAENAGYGARLKQYQKEIEETVGRIKLVYDQFKFLVL